MADVRVPPKVIDDSTPDARMRYFDTMLAWFKPRRVIDLGAGHGAFSIRAADAGWDVTAVDARTVRFPEDPRISWVHEDVRESDLSGYDLILNLGLFYHLTLSDQVSLLDRSAGTPMILDTHVGIAGDTAYSLSDIVTLDGHEGRLYSEEGIQHDPRSSFGNLSSFWPTPDTLLRMLGERGWDVYTAPYYLSSRTFFLCIPRTNGQTGFLAPPWLRSGAGKSADPRLRKARARQRAAERRVAELEASTSWKLTEPVRRLSGLARRARG